MLSNNINSKNLELVFARESPVREPLDRQKLYSIAILNCLAID